MMKILLFPVKLVILPVVLLLSLLSMLGKLATNISAYVAGLFILFLLVICGCCLWQHRWMDAAIIAVLGVGILALQFGSMLLAEVAGEWAGKLVGSLRS